MLALLLLLSPWQHWLDCGYHRHHHGTEERKPKNKSIRFNRHARLECDYTGGYNTADSVMEMGGRSMS